jgi:hypothetical protein
MDLRMPANDTGFSLPARARTRLSPLPYAGESTARVRTRRRSALGGHTMDAPRNEAQRAHSVRNTAKATAWGGM